MLIFLLACAQSGEISGQVTDARTGQPLADLALDWVSDDAKNCERQHVRTDNNGNYTAKNICKGQDYHLEFEDPDWWTEARALKLSTDSMTENLAIWRLPAVGGVYRLNGTELSLLKTVTALDRSILTTDNTEVRFPLEIPGTLPRISGDALLLLSGPVTDALNFEALIPAGPVRLGQAENPQEAGPWFYLGISLNPTAPHPVALAPAHIKTIGEGSRKTRMIDANALPAGRYALSGPQSNRAFLLDFGEAPATPEHSGTEQSPH